MAASKNAIKELALLIAQERWSWDRVEIAIRAVCTPKAQPGNALIAVEVYARAMRQADAPRPRVIVRAVKKRRSKR